jgi:polycystin 2
VKNDSCEVHPEFQNAIKTCYEAYSPRIEDKNPFGNGFRRRTGADA